MKWVGIVAASENGIIGRDGKLPWHIPQDLKEFKRLTKGHIVVMGRKTFESIGRPLPERRNIVLSQNQNFRADGAEVFSSWTVLKNTLSRQLSADQTAFIIGGSQLYELAWRDLSELFLTLVHDQVSGDAKLPFFENISKEFRELSRTRHSQDAPEKREFSFISLKRIS